MSDNKPIEIRIRLIQARFPTLHAEALYKIKGGVKSSDVLADWLNELMCLRGERANLIVAPETPKNEDLDDLARSAMQGLLG